MVSMCSATWSPHIRPATVSKYRNRRLYHTSHRRYVNLEDIAFATDEKLSGLALRK